MRYRWRSLGDIIRISCGIYFIQLGLLRHSTIRKIKIVSLSTFITGLNDSPSSSAGVAVEIDVEARSVAEAVLFAELRDDGRSGVEFFCVDSFWHQHDVLGKRGEVVAFEEFDDFSDVGFMADDEFELEIAMIHPGTEDIRLPASGFVSG